MTCDMLNSYDLTEYVQLPFSYKQFKTDVSDKLILNHVVKWRNDLQNTVGKLRTYKLFKHCYETESYCRIPLPYRQRSALAKFRCGVAPLRIETGRYQNIPENERVCPFCTDTVESEMHVLLHCPSYCSERNILIEKVVEINQQFLNLSDSEKFTFMFNHPDLIKILAKTCCNILKVRNNLLYCKGNSDT